LGPASGEELEGREFDENLPGQVLGYLIHMHGGGELESRHVTCLGACKRRGVYVFKEKTAAECTQREPKWKKRTERNK